MRVSFGSASGRPPQPKYVIGFTAADCKLCLAWPTFPAYLVGIKYSKHYLSDPPVGERPADAYVRMTMLVEGGHWYQKSWLIGGGSLELELQDTGDYVCWEPGVVHEWRPLGEARMLTVTFKRFSF